MSTEGDKISRKEFLRYCAALGIGLPFMSLIPGGCKKEIISSPEFEVNFNGSVLIVGAGAAGLTAGYLLKRYNIDFKIIEASSVFGGRMKRAGDFSDFPIDLGAEWIHENPSILAELLSDANISANIDVMPYSPETVYSYKNGKLKKHNWVSNFYSEYKFKNTTWYGFFENFMVPHIADNIVYNSPVNEINYTADKVTVKTTQQQTFEADKVLIALPMKILQSNSVKFFPELPAEKLETINGIEVPDGIKVFIEFSEKFYPDMLFTDGIFDVLVNGDSGDDKLYYNAAFRKNSSRNILGLFSVGNVATPYTSLETEAEIIAKILNELDEIFEGKATQTYIKHIVQNWSKEPYIQGSYAISSLESLSKTAEKLLKPISNKLYFAGSALGGEDRVSTVPGASKSAYTAIELILAG